MLLSYHVPFMGYSTSCEVYLIHMYHTTRWYRIVYVPLCTGLKLFCPPCPQCTEQNGTGKCINLYKNWV